MQKRKAEWWFTTGMCLKKPKDRQAWDRNPDTKSRTPLETSGTTAQPNKAHSFSKDCTH